jgi:hypothetical protein
VKVEITKSDEVQVTMSKAEARQLVKPDFTLLMKMKGEIIAAIDKPTSNGPRAA